MKFDKTDLRKLLEKDVEQILEAESEIGRVEGIAGVLVRQGKVIAMFVVQPKTFGLNHSKKTAFGTLESWDAEVIGLVDEPDKYVRELLKGHGTCLGDKPLAYVVNTGKHESVAFSSICGGGKISWCHSEDEFDAVAQSMLSVVGPAAGDTAEA